MKKKRLLAGIICLILSVTDLMTSGLTVHAEQENQIDVSGADITYVEEAETETETEAEMEEETESGPSEEAAAESDVFEESETPVALEGDYLTEDPGFNFKNITVTPKSYSVDLTADASDMSGNLSSFYFGDLVLLYTTDENEAVDFFSGVSKISKTMLDTKENFGVEERGDYQYNQTDKIYNASYFLGSAETTYYWRLAYRKRERDTELGEYVDCYYFLTLPEQFTTGLPVENSEVSLKDFQMKESGYTRVRFAWTMDNPNNEEIKKYTCCQEVVNEDGSKSVREEKVYYSESAQEYYVEIADRKVETAQIRMEIPVGKDQIKEVVSEKLPVEFQDISPEDVAVEVRTGSGNVAMDLAIPGVFGVDRAYLQISLFYRKKGMEDQFANNRWSWEMGQARTTFLKNGLEENTEYEYYLELGYSNGGWIRLTSLGSADTPYGTFTTKEVVVYTDQDFPDDVFRNYLRERCKIAEGDPITSDKLEQLTSLYYIRYNADGNINSLQGIEYIINLTSIDFAGHDITDVGGLESLTRLEEIGLSNNDLTVMPDLSKMSRLRRIYLSNNRLEAETLTPDKISSRYLEENPNWLSSTLRDQRGEVDWELMPKYYASGDKRPFFLIVTGGLKRDFKRPYNVQITINGESVSSSRNVDTSYFDYPIYAFCIDDLSNIIDKEGIYTASIKLEDTYGHTWLELPEQELTFVDDNPVAEAYCTPESYSARIIIKELPGMIKEEDITSIELQDQKGKKVGEASLISGVNIDEAGRYYGKLGYHCMIRDLYSNIEKATCDVKVDFEQQLPAGEYGVVIYTTLGNYTIENALHISRMPTITNMYHDQSYSCYGDYEYVRLTGINIDFSKVWPVIYQEGEKITELVEVLPVGDGVAVYKLRKLKKDLYWNFDTAFSYVDDTRKKIEIETKSGYEVLNRNTEEFFSWNDLIDFAVDMNTGYYNCRKNAYMINMRCKTTDKTQITVWAYTDKDFIDLKGIAEGEVRGGLQELKFYDEQGKSYIPPKDENLCIRYSFGNGGGGSAWPVRINWYGYEDGIRTNVVDSTNNTSYLRDNGSVVGLYINTYPARVMVSRMGDTRLYADFETPGQKAGSLYLFTEDDLKDTDPNEVYTIAVREGDGKWWQVTGCIAKDQQDGAAIVEPAVLTLTPQTLTLGIGQTATLTPTIKPDNATNKTLTWLSSDENIASVEDGVVTANAIGTAVITATTSNGLEASCVVTVQDITSGEDITEIPSGLHALTNVQDTLGKVELGLEGWEWEYGDTLLQPFAGLQQKTFIALYRKTPEALPYRMSLPVSLSTVTGISITGEHATMQNDSTQTLSINWKVNGTQSDMSDYAQKVTWSSSNPAVAEITRDGLTAVLTAKKAGKAVITASAALGTGKPFTAKYSITVADGQTADIRIESVTEFTKSDDNIDTYVTTVDTKSAALTVTASNTAKLTVKSSSPKALTAGKAVRGEKDTYTIPLTVKAAGTVKLTLTAGDAAKTSKEIWLYITDPQPNLGESVVTLNLKETTGSKVYLYPNQGYEVNECVLSGNSASAFVMEKGEEADCYIIKAKEGTAPGSYLLSLEGKTKSGTDGSEYNYTLDFTVKAKEQAPKYTIKQKGKLNLFYTDSRSPLEISSEETLEEIHVDSDDFELTEENGVYYLSAKKQAPDTRVVLELTFKGYKTEKKDYKIATEKKAPRITLGNKSVTFYPALGITSAALGVKADGAVCDPTNITVTLKDAQGVTVNGVTAALENGKLLLDGSALPADTTVRGKLEFLGTGWTEAVTVPCTLKTSSGQPAVKLQKSTLQLNTKAEKFDTAVTEVFYKSGADFDPLDVSFTGKDQKSKDILDQTLILDYDKENRQIVAHLSGQPAKGNYKFVVNAKITDTVIISNAVLTIRIVDVDLDKAVKVTQKGSIDVLNRSNTFVAVTPALKSIGGEVADVSLKGRDSHLFDASWEDGRVIITAKPDAALITKYNYMVDLNLTLTNAEGRNLQYTKKNLKLKLKQGKPKASVSPKNTAFYSGAPGMEKRLRINASLKGAETPVITNVELINNTGAFACEYADGILILKSTKEAIKGKNYSLQFKVTYEGQADNEKPAVIKCSVKVK